MNESRSKQSLRFRPVRGGCVINRMATVRTMSRPLAIIMLVRRAVYLLHFCSFRRLILFPASKEGPVGEGVVHKEEDNETVHRQSVSPLLCRLRFDGSFYGQRLRPVLFSAVLILSPSFPCLQCHHIHAADRDRQNRIRMIFQVRGDDETGRAAHSCRLMQIFSFSCH
jgi:hypothetical protein